MINFNINKIKEKLNENEERENKKQLNIISYIINWIECYKIELITILKIYLLLENKTNDLYSFIKQIFMDHQKIKKNRNSKNIINESILIGIESLLSKFIYDEKFLNDNIGDDDTSIILHIINMFREILQDLSKIQKNLNLNSNELLSLQEITEIFNLFYINNINNKETFIKVIQYFSQEAQLIKEKNDINDLDETFDEKFYEFYQFLLNKIGNENDNNFSKIMSIIFENEFKKIKDDEFRKKIIETILKNSSFIYNSSNLIEYILKYNIKSDDNNNIKNDLSNIQENSNNGYVQILNENNNTFLEEIILHYFELRINFYFDNLNIQELNNNKINLNDKNGKNIEVILTEENKNIFYNSIDILISILDKKEIINMNLCKLYSISYIKIYLYKFAYLCIKYNQQLDYTCIFNKINEINNKNLRKVIKFDLYKLYYNNVKKNYDEFIQRPFISKFKAKDNFEFNEKEKNILIYYFFPSEKEDYQKYLEQCKIFDECTKNNNYENFLQNIESNLDIFIIITINKIINKINLDKDKEKDNNSIDFKYFSNENTKLCNENLFNLLSLYYNKDKFYEMLKEKLSKEEEIDQNLFIILLYGFRYCAQSLNNKNNNNLYCSLFSENCLNILNESYIPGNNILEDLHLYTIFDIEDHFNKYPSTYGCYVCPDGHYYSTDPIGILNNKEQCPKCPICKIEIGYGKNAKIKNNQNYEKIHYRIVKNEDDKNKETNKNEINEGQFQIKTLKEYKEEIIEKLLLNKEKPGLNIINKKLFLSKKERIGHLSKIGYRLLNFIIYNYLFFANYLGFISDENLKNYCLIKEMSCLEIIESNWNLLKEALHEKSINSIEIFMNLIFKNLSNLLNKDTNSFQNVEKRNIFEKEVEKIIIENINNYNDYQKFYFDEQYKQLNIKKDEEENKEKNKEINNKDDIKIIVNEVFPLEYYPENDYPFFKYFMYTEYPDKNNFILKFQEIGETYKYQYPLLYQLLLDDPNLKKLKYFYNFNEFCNYMLDHYSYKISRDKASKISLNDLKLKDYTDIQFNNFCTSWNEIYKDAKEYKGNLVNQKTLNENDKLIYFLNDDKDMHIAAAYQLFISLQNSFLQPIYDANAYNGILHFYAHNLKNRIPIQEAKQNQILSLDDINIEEIISKHSKRDILREKDNIYYYNYNNFIYDFDLIEKELGELILPGKCLFDENKLRYVSFWLENNTNIFTTFSEIYHQKELDQETKNIITNFFCYENNNDKNGKKEIYISYQNLLNYFNNYHHDEEDIITTILNDESEYIKIPNKLYELFGKDEFKINQLLNIYLVIEEIMFDEIKEKKFKNNNLFNNIQKKINSDELKKISKKIDLLRALKRYFLRYLIDDYYIKQNSERNIALELEKSELWNVNENKLKEIKEVLNKQLKDYDIKVKESYHFYEIINNDNDNDNDYDL